MTISLGISGDMRKPKVGGYDSKSADLGFSIERGVLSVDECDSLLAGLEGTARTLAGVRHLMSHPVVAAVAREERILRIAREGFGGSAAIPFRATLFEKTGRANWLVAWHQDTALPLREQFDGEGWGPWSRKAGILYAHAPEWALSRVVALRLHLDDSTSDNGPLRVIPGSHRLGVLSDADVIRYAASPPATECIVAKGGVLAMSPLIIHASSKARNEEPRRVLHIEYADSLELGRGIRLAVA